MRRECTVSNGHQHATPFWLRARGRCGTATACQICWPGQWNSSAFHHVYIRRYLVSSFSFSLDPIAQMTWPGLLQQQKVTPNTWSQLVLRNKMSSWFCFFHYCTDCFSQFYSLWHFLRLILKKQKWGSCIYLLFTHTHDIDRKSVV